MPKRRRQSRRLGVVTEEDLKYARAAGLLYHVAMTAGETDPKVLEAMGYSAPFKVSEKELAEIIKLLNAPPEPTEALLKAAQHWEEEVNKVRRKGG